MAGANTTQVETETRNTGRDGCSRRQALRGRRYTKEWTLVYTRGVMMVKVMVGVVEAQRLGDPAARGHAAATALAPVSEGAATGGGPAAAGGDSSCCFGPGAGVEEALSRSWSRSGRCQRTTCSSGRRQQRSFCKRRSPNKRTSTAAPRDVLRSSSAGSSSSSSSFSSSRLGSSISSSSSSSSS